jgi:hypothetical protein
MQNCTASTSDLARQCPIIAPHARAAAAPPAAAVQKQHETADCHLCSHHGFHIHGFHITVFTFTVFKHSTHLGPGLSRVARARSTILALFSLKIVMRSVDMSSDRLVFTLPYPLRDTSREQVRRNPPAWPEDLVISRC